MKIIIEQKDVGIQIDLFDLVKQVEELRGKYLHQRTFSDKELDSLLGKTSSGAKVTIVKERKKPGPKPKIKEPIAIKTRKKPGPKKAKPQPLPDSSDINPLTGEPYVRRGFTIDTPVRVIPVENEEQFNKKLQSL